MFKNVNIESPLLLRLSAWFSERFPLAAFISAFLVFYLVAFVLKSTSAGLALSFEVVLGALAVSAHFLFLRVLDEHKDFKHDCEVHRGRVLQRGIVSLGNLKIIGIIALVSQIFVTSLSGVNAFLAWSAMSLWVFLMFKEFFIGEWLKKRLLLYSISHMLIMPFTICWIALLTSKNFIMKDLVLLCVLTFVCGMIYELTRKTKGVEEEVAGEESFSASYGPSRMSFVIALTMIGALVIYFFFNLNNQQAHALIAQIIVGGSALYALYTLYSYARKPTTKSRKMNEISTASFVFWLYLSLILGS